MRIARGVALLLCLFVTSYGCDTPTSPSEPRLEIVHVYGPWGISATGAQDLVLVSPDGGTSRPLLTLPGSELFPEWSPDGKQILFGRYGDDRAWIVNEDGGDAHPINTIRGSNFSWSPDGAWILYTRTTGSLAIVIARPDGSGERILVSEAYAATWSPDGRIAFEPAFEFGVWTIRSDGTGLTQLTTDPGDGWPRWSPDGSRLLLNRFDGLLVMNGDGSNRRFLTNSGTEYWDDAASWAPDGQWILFARHWNSRRQDACALYKVPVGGGDLVAVVAEKPVTGCYGASWRR